MECTKMDRPTHREIQRNYSVEKKSTYSQVFTSISPHAKRISKTNKIIKKARSLSNYLPSNAKS